MNHFCMYATHRYEIVSDFPLVISQTARILCIVLLRPHS